MPDRPSMLSMPWPWSWVWQLRLWGFLALTPMIRALIRLQDGIGGQPLARARERRLARAMVHPCPACAAAHGWRVQEECLSCGARFPLHVVEVHDAPTP